MKKAYQKSIDEIYTELNTSKNGLSKTEVLKRQKTNGLNVLIDKNKRTKLQIFLSQFKNMMIILLLVVGFLSLIYSLITGDDFLEPLVILGTTLVNCIMGYFQESKAANATEKLKKYSANYVTVRRNGTSTDIDAKELVPGDYIILEAGDKVPADARIVESYFAKTDESILTGESNNVEKNEITIPNETILAETYNMIYSGTVVVSGKIEAIVISTGMNTELGKIASVLDTKEEPATPIQMKVAKVSRFITGVAFILIAFVLIFGLINHYTILNIVMLCISMIVASVPESLTIAITATLSIGVSGMAKKKSIVKNLAAIETLGSTEVICTDKTGTLTENKMKVTKLYTDNKEIGLNDIKNYQTLINVMDNSNSATLASDGLYTGDAVDVAIKNYLKENNLKSEEVTKITELPFDSKRKMMSAVYKKDGETYLYLKGSLEAILQRSTKILINNELQNLTDEYINNKVLYKRDDANQKKIYLWIKHCDKLIINQKVNEYSSDNLNNLLEELKKEENKVFNANDIIKLLNKYGIYLVIEKALQGTKVRGCMMVKITNPAIYLTNLFKEKASFYFALYHELAHVKRNYNMAKKRIIIDDASDENEIDKIALNWMIDKNIWQSIKENPNKVKEICKKNNIPVCFATSRLAKEGIISHKSKLYLDNRESID